jgi:hypothetical protein
VVFEAERRAERSVEDDRRWGSMAGSVMKSVQAPGRRAASQFHAPGLPSDRRQAQRGTAASLHGWPSGCPPTATLCSVNPEAAGCCGGRIGLGSPVKKPGIVQRQ